MELGGYILGSEVFETLRVKTENELERRFIEKLNWESAVHLLINANLLLSLFHRTHTTEFAKTQNFLAETFFSDSILEKLRSSKFNGRLALHRQLILTVIKKVMRSGTDVNGRDPNSSIEDKKFLGKTLLHASDFLSEPTTTGREELIAQLVPTFELYNPPNLDGGIARTLEYIRIFDTKYPDFHETLSLDQFFNNATGISLKTLLEVTGAIYAYFFTNDENLELFINDPSKLNLSRSRYFKHLGDSSSEVDAVFRLFCRDRHELRDEVISTKGLDKRESYDFSVFRKFPLVYINNDVFTCVDFGFLTEKVSFGFYRTIFNALPDNAEIPGTKEKAIAGKLSEGWGTSIELYVQSIFEKQECFYPDVKFKSGKGKDEQIDGVFVCGQRAILIEIKGRFLSGRAKYAGDKTVIEEIDKKFGRNSKDDKGAIYQLARDIKLLYGGDSEEQQKLSDFTCPTSVLDANAVYSVLITDESTLRLDLIQWLLRDWFEEEFAKEKLRKGLIRKPVLILPLETLEEIEPFLIDNDFEFIEFVEYYCSLVDLRLAFPLLASDQVFRRFLSIKELDPKSNRRTWDIFTSFIEGVKKKLEA